MCLCTISPELSYLNFYTTAGRILQAMGNGVAVIRTLSKVQELPCKIVHLIHNTAPVQCQCYTAQKVTIRGILYGHIRFSNWFLLGCTFGCL